MESDTARTPGPKESYISVIRVRDLLMVTMPADPDDATISTLQERVLVAMEQNEAKGIVLDISSVETLDSFFARTLTETAQMVGLMGGRTIIAGMRPAVAVTVTQIGLSLGKVECALNVDRALDMVAKSPSGNHA
jgi:rsbT antagonist protein RsbS